MLLVPFLTPTEKKVSFGVRGPGEDGFSCNAIIAANHSNN